MNFAVLQCRHLLSVADSIMDGLDDSHRAMEPHHGSKTAGWLIGHLAVTGDFGRKLCGRSPMCPTEWRRVFNPGTQPSTRPDDYPPMEQLRERFRATYEDLCVAAAEATPERLNAINPFTPAAGEFPTAGDFVGYLLAGHLGYHLGQLYAWRAASGTSRLQQVDSQAE